MFQKYANALALMDAVIAVNGPVNAEWDTLYTFVHANFMAPKSAYTADKTGPDVTEFESDVEEMIEMFGKDRATLEVELRKIPPVIAEVAFPVYIARYLLRDCRVEMSTSKLATFKEFFERYAYMIINGAYKRHK